jgi:hypothetical protein
MAKRLFDLLGAALGLLLLSPLMLAISVAIKLDSRGPVFFRQQRVGRHGLSFRIHKFRTMVADAPQRGPALTVGDDPRITRSRPLAAAHAAGRTAAADRRAGRPHEPGRPAARGTDVRGALPGGAARACAVGAPRHHRPVVAAVPGREPSCWRALPTPSANTSRSSCRASCNAPPTMRREPACCSDLGVLLRTLRLLMQR